MLSCMCVCVRVCLFFFFWFLFFVICVGDLFSSGYKGCCCFCFFFDEFCLCEIFKEVLCVGRKVFPKISGCVRRGGRRRGRQKKKTKAQTKSLLNLFLTILSFPLVHIAILSLLFFSKQHFYFCFSFRIAFYFLNGGLCAPSHRTIILIFFCEVFFFFTESPQINVSENFF